MVRPPRPRQQRRAHPTTGETHSFRLCCKNIFLTFSQCPINLGVMLDFLWTLVLQNSPKYIVVASELHQDGKQHLHAIIQLDRKLNTVNQRLFDYTGTDPTLEQAEEAPDGTQLPQQTWHPSFEPLRHPTKGREYVIKDGTFVERGTFNPKGKSPSKLNQNALWSKILTDAESREDFIRLVRERSPGDFVLRWPAIDKFARDNYRVEVQPYTSPFSVYQRLPAQLKKWADDNILFVSKHYVDHYLCKTCADHAHTSNYHLKESLLNYEPVPDYSSSSPLRSQEVDQPDPSLYTSSDAQERARLLGLGVWDDISFSRGV